MISILQDPWTAEQIDTIRAEWAAGASAAQIGKRLGRSKNSVTGKARRLGMPARPSPIVRRAGQQEVVGTAESQKCLSATRAALSPLSSPEFDRKTAAQVPTADPARSCEWIDGERGAYVKCGRPLERGSYCAEHGDRCYVGERKPRETVVTGPRDAA